MEEKSCGIIPVWVTPGRHRFLLIQHNAGHWGFPKGHQEEAETNMETAEREFNEETGLSLKKIFHREYVEQYIFKRTGQLSYKKVIYFLGIVEPGPVKVQAEEIKSYEWLSYATAYKRLKFPEIKQILELAEKNYRESRNDFMH